MDFAVSAELKAAFDKQRCGDISNDYIMRSMKVRVVDETFTVVEQLPWTQEDEAAALQRSRAMLSETEACYLLFRLDQNISSKWVLISFVPDSAPVRDKMLYASSSATLRRSLGGGDVFSHDFHFSNLDEVALESKSYSESRTALQAVMTETERLTIEEDRMVAKETASGYGRGLRTFVHPIP